MKGRGWLNLRSFLAAQLWNLRGGKIYLRLQIKFLTEVFGPHQKDSKSRGSSEDEGEVVGPFPLFLNSSDFFFFFF